MTEQPTVKTVLVISSVTDELDFDGLTVAVGRSPYSTRSLDHRTAGGRPAPVKRSEWILSSGADVLDSVSQGVSQLLDQFPERLDHVSQFCKSRSYQISIVSRVSIYDWDDRPSVELDCSAVVGLATLGAAWQLDLADFSR
jgi:Domain of unknown function (DUF4279)